MKRVSLIVAFLMLTVLHNSSGQNAVGADINRIVEAINMKDSHSLLGMMTSDCTIGNLEKGDNSILLPAILKSFKKIGTYTIAFDSLRANGNRLVGLKVAYEDGRTGRPDLTFNADGKLLNLGIIHARKRIDVQGALAEALAGVKRPDTVTLPFRLRNGLIYMPAQLNGVEGYFLFDSGCPVVLLNKKFSNHSKVIKGLSFDFMGMGGKMEEQVWSRENHLKWAGTDLLLDAPASYMDGAELDDDVNFFGLLGYAMFSDYQITFDYQAERLLLERVDTAGKLTGAGIYKGKLVAGAPLAMRRHIPVVSLRLGSRDYPMGIDCGANANVVQASLKGAIGKLFDQEEQGVSINGVGNANESASSCYLMGASVAGLPLQDMYTVLTRQPIGAGSGEHSLGVLGLLGAPFLNQYRTTLNFYARSISFYK